ncbi:Regulator of Vps4 activity in the MVB pathway protein [Rhynchospora pubera]|uniref:Regulator of Vps4 activity in the MVB pathway protein n=1 Tax=Rhynchospora pubera TaxID=906938 RepID=A0AAV8FK96_9POAL|nr:Regulator of Vps4 activity in the MVB pathway protein [Rhynchospora pubera]
MGRKLDILLGRISRENAKLKSLLSVTASRAVVLKSRRVVRCNNTRDDVAQLLILGHHDRALLRVEHVVKEQNMVDVYSMIESYCYVISERCAMLEKTTRECPEELQEAVSGLIFATSRCGDLQELQDVRRIFVSRFGKEFVEAATQLRNGCAVDLKLIQKLSTRLPSLETRQKVLQEIATEKGIKLESNVEISFQTPAAITATTHHVDQHQTGGDLDDAFLKEEMGKYKDASTAAQAAFRSAASAAAAAKAAMELSKSDFRGNDGGHNSKSGKELVQNDKSTEDDLDSDSDLEIVEEKQVQKSVYVEKQPEARGKPQSVRTRKGNV